MKQDFMHPIKEGRQFASLDEARLAPPQAGDAILIRDLSQLAPPETWTLTETRGKWHLRPYRLADGQSGQLLMVSDFAGDEGRAAVPPEFEVRLDLPGWYAIWIGSPLMERAADGGGSRNVDGMGGINVALDGEPGYTLIAPEAGRFRGRWAHPCNCEYMCYWKCARLAQRTLYLRSPWGTYSSAIWGQVRGGFSALRLIRLSDQQAQAYLDDVADPATKRVMVICDGFHYWGFGEPGKGMDAQLAMAYRDTDVGKFLLQTPSTGVASWPSQVTSLAGELVSDDEWKLLRKGDRRIHDYVRWAVRNQQEGFRVFSEVLKGSHTELHASLRMNLFFAGGGPSGPIDKLLNGSWWFRHPENRKPGGLQLDYALPSVRAFIIAILMELAGDYDVAGVNMDFTRWPPIADPARHDFGVLTSFIKEVRGHLDEVESRKGRKIALSAHVADAHYTGGDLASQKIDLEAWLATGVLDFISVETSDQAKYLAIARRYKVPYYASQDCDGFPLQDPELSWPWSHDPYPGDEFIGQEQFDRQFGAGVDPTDYDRGFANSYQLGVDGVCLTNNYMGWRTIGRMGHREEVAERAGTGEIWGQEPGPAISVL